LVSVLLLGVLVTYLAICQCLTCSANGEKSSQKKSVFSLGIIWKDNTMALVSIVGKSINSPPAFF